MLDLRIFQTSRVKLVPQTEVTECGLACVAMIATFHGLHVDLVSLRRRFPQSLHGTKLRTLMDISSALDLVPRAVNLPLSKISSLNLPAILHWDLNHYVVIEKVKKSRALIHDPGGRSSWVSLETLSNHFTGVALELRPTLDFVRGNLARTLRLSDLWSQAKGFVGPATQIVLLSVFIEVFLIASPYFTQLAIDTILPSTDSDALLVLGISFSLFCLMSAVAFALRGVITSSLGAQLGFGISVNVGRRLSRLPLSWFEKRKVGDVLSRFLSIVPIQRTLTEGALVGIVDGCLAAITLFMMFFYSARLSLITVGSFFIYLLIRTLVLWRLRAAQESSLTARAQEQSFLIESIQGIASIRLASKDDYRHSLWQSYLSQAVNADIRISRLMAWQGTANFAIFNLENIAIISYGIHQIIYEQGITVGMLMAFVSYKSHFISKASSLLDQLLAVRLMSLHLDRLSDITQSDEDVVFREGAPGRTVQGVKVEMRGVCFGYLETAEPIVKNINLSIRPGEHVALSGASGSGKSTIVKLLLGALKPTSGEIFINDVPISQFGYRNLHSITAAVTQDDKLFAGSIRENIALFEPDADINNIVAAAMAASLHGEILAFPMQYETFVGDMGSALSSGQRQRVLIARALFRKPRLLIMDEGTANIDEANENKIFQWLAMTGASMLTISHKPSTVSKGDRAVHIDGGVLEENALALAINRPEFSDGEVD